MPEDVKDQVISEIKASPSQCFFHVDELTDVTSCAQLLVFVRYMLKEGLLISGNCKLQQAQMFGRSKNLLIRQGCNGNMIVTPP